MTADGCCAYGSIGKAPDVVRTVEEIAAADKAKRKARKLRKLAAAPQPQPAADPR